MTQQLQAAAAAAARERCLANDHDGFVVGRQYDRLDSVTAQPACRAKVGRD